MNTVVKNLGVYLLAAGASLASVQAGDITLTAIGTGGCLPVKGHGAPCNLVQIDGQKIIVDTGTGSIQALVDRGVELDDVSAIFYSHFHVDHFADIMSVLSRFQVKHFLAKMIDAQDTNARVKIYGPVGIKEQVITKFLPVTALNYLPDNLEFIEIKPGQECMLGKTKVEVHKTLHTAESQGYRFISAKGNVIAISGDTATDPAVVRLIKDADIAVLECSYSDEDDDKTQPPVLHHLGPTRAAKLAQEAKVRTLVFTHLYPSALAVDVEGLAKKVFAGNVIKAVDGLTVTVE